MNRKGRARLIQTIPCDLSKQVYCNLPGAEYPWHAVRRFVHENQGLMRRMYGDVRHISVLKDEIENNEIEIDDIKKATERYSRQYGQRKMKYDYKTNDVLTEPYFRPSQKSSTTTTTTTNKPTTTATTTQKTTDKIDHPDPTTTTKPKNTTELTTKSLPLEDEKYDIEQTLNDNLADETVDIIKLAEIIEETLDEVSQTTTEALEVTTKAANCTDEASTISTTLKLIPPDLDSQAQEIDATAIKNDTQKEDLKSLPVIKDEEITVVDGDEGEIEDTQSDIPDSLAVESNIDSQKSSSEEPPKKAGDSQLFQDGAVKDQVSTRGV